jgi:hypothetical protein
MSLPSQLLYMKGNTITGSTFCNVGWTCRPADLPNCAADWIREDLEKDDPVCESVDWDAVWLYDYKIKRADLQRWWLDRITLDELLLRMKEVPYAELDAEQLKALRNQERP